MCVLLFLVTLGDQLLAHSSFTFSAPKRNKVSSIFKYFKRVVYKVNYLCYALCTEEIVISKVKKVNWKALKKRHAGDVICKSTPRTRLVP